MTFGGCCRPIVEAVKTLAGFVGALREASLADGSLASAAEPRPRSPRMARSLELAGNLAAPVVLTGVAMHELLYNRASILTWVLFLAIIWPLAWRRRAPILVLATCLALSTVCWTLNTLTVAELASLVALYSVAAHRSTTFALASGAVVEIGAVLIAVRFAPTDSVNDGVILLSGLVAAALLLGTTVRAQRRYLASVEDRARRLEHERAQQAELAAAAERTHIAREMHDIIAHGLSVVITLAQGAAIAVAENPQSAAHAMEQAAAAGRQSLDEMRKLLHVLRTDSTEHQASKNPQPDLDSLDVLVEDIRRTGLRVNLIRHGDGERLSAAAQTTLYRIVQEALTNVLKHADRASTATVALDFQPTEVRFTVENDSRVPAARAPVADLGNGLIGMQERVAVFGGSIDSGPSSTGWLVRGQLPVA